LNQSENGGGAVRKTFWQGYSEDSFPHEREGIVFSKCVQYIGTSLALSKTAAGMWFE